MVGLVSMMIKKIMACIMSVCMFMSIVSSGEKETNTGEKETTGSNTDLDYNVDLNGAGASLPYTTYEAEAASTNAEVLSKSRTYRTDIQSEASGRQGVKLKNNGDYVEFTLQKPDIF